MGRLLTDAVDRDALLSWGSDTRRDLPWRRTRDPWAVMVSEMMLQQTQVNRVIPRYEEFMARFPDVGSCAAAPQAEVVRLWAGLGYNRRARHLHQSAVVVVSEHSGLMPSRLDLLLALPGVGPYTARAIQVFAFEYDVGPVDTNVARVLARWTGQPLGRAEVQDLADRMVPAGQGWAWTQALFDLGAGVCTKRAPTCVRCPVSAGCAWRGEGNDPAEGSAGVSRTQSRFEGSDRQGRGRLMAALRSAPVPTDEVAVTLGWPDDEPRAAVVVAALIDEGLAVEGEGSYHLA
ncbi:MAG: A/G-specific adenine glycosylase [Acidimicrobiales bacterium]